jgi:hypothetical protein
MTVTPTCSELMALPLARLRAEARAARLKGYSKARKAELAAALADHLAMQWRIMDRRLSDTTPWSTSR